MLPWLLWDLQNQFRTSTSSVKIQFLHPLFSWNDIYFHWEGLLTYVFPVIHAQLLFVHVGLLSLWYIILIGLRLVSIPESWDTGPGTVPAQYIFKTWVFSARDSKSFLVQLPLVKPLKTSLGHWKSWLTPLCNPVVPRPGNHRLSRSPLPKHPSSHPCSAALRPCSTLVHLSGLLSSATNLWVVGFWLLSIFHYYMIEYSDKRSIKAKT